MRTLAICLALAPTVSSVLGQTLSVVAAENFDANHGSGAPIYYLSPGTLAPVGQNIFVQILGGPVGGAMEPLTDRSGSILTIAIGTGGSGPGFFDASMAVIPGVAPNAQAQFELRAWQGSEGFAKAAYAATSSVWVQSTGFFSVPVNEYAAPAIMPPWSGLTVVRVPEPSAVLLAFLGGVVWLLQRRRRRVSNRLQTHEE